MQCTCSVECEIPSIPPVHCGAGGDDVNCDDVVVWLHAGEMHLYLCGFRGWWNGGTNLSGCRRFRIGDGEASSDLWAVE